MIFKTCINGHEYPKEYKVFTIPSLTIPDQAISIKEMIARFTMGLPIHGNRVPIYDGDQEYFPDLDKMDLVDRDEYIKSSVDRLNDHKRLKKEQDDKNDAEMENRINEAVRRKLDEQSGKVKESLNPIQ